MKTEGQVRHKLQQVTYRHLQRETRTALSRRPENCTHNQAIRLPHGKEVRFCTWYGENSESYLCCDEAHGGLEQASRCLDFEKMHSKESVRKDFEEFLATSELAMIAAKYPDIVALMWVLDMVGADIVGMDLSEDPDCPSSQEAPQECPAVEPPTES